MDVPEGSIVWSPADGLPHCSGHITSHSNSGSSIFATSDHGGAHQNILYSTPSVPTDLNDEADITFSKATELGIPTPNSIQVRMTDFAPGVETPLHRTLLLDHAVLLEGTIEITLYRGESRLLRRGDVVVQRVTMHKWRNVSQTESARLIYFIVDVTHPVLAGGQELKKDMNIITVEYADAKKGVEEAHSN